MSRTVFREELCKGCGLCVQACPRHILALAEDRINHKGYRPATNKNSADCTGCAVCARNCPDVVIEVYKS